MTLKAAMELGLIDALAEAAASSTEGGALTAGEVVALLPAANKADAEAGVDRMLRFLAGHGLVRCATEEADDGAVVPRYTPAPVCRWPSSKQGEGTLAPLALFGFHKDMLMPWHCTLFVPQICFDDSGDQGLLAFIK